MPSHEKKGSRKVFAFAPLNEEDAPQNKNSATPFFSLPFFIHIKLLSPQEFIYPHSSTFYKLVQSFDAVLVFPRVQAQDGSGADIHFGIKFFVKFFFAVKVSVAFYHFVGKFPVT